MVPQKGSSRNSLSEVGFQALLKLDSDGRLSKYIVEEDWTGLRDTLNLVLPTGAAFNLTVYNRQMQQINTEIVSNGNIGSQNVAFTEYICASQSLTFQCYIIHLYLAVTA
jgi:hypothetical protein